MLALLLAAQAVCFAAVEGTRNASGTLNRTVSVDPTGRTEGFSAVLYNNLNGLPTSEANAIAETDEGFPWIGSYAGLIRYDGNTFERMDSTGGISSIKCLFVDSRGRLWIATWRKYGLLRYDQGELTAFTVEDGLFSDRVRVACERPDGSMLVANTGGVSTERTAPPEARAPKPFIHTDFGVLPLPGPSVSLFFLMGQRPPG